MSTEPWMEATIGDAVSSIRSGFSATGEDRNASDGECGVLKTGAVLSGAFRPQEHKAVIAHAERLRVSVKHDTVLLGRKNSADVVGSVVHVDHDFESLFLSDLIWELTPAPNIDSRWLAYALQDEQMHQRIRLGATGTQSTMKNLNRDVFRSIPLRVPPLAEQRKIAEILRTWDDAIDGALRTCTAAIERRNWLRTHIASGRETGYRSTPWTTVKLADVLTEHGSKSTGLEEVFSVSVHKGLVNQVDHLGRSFSAKQTNHYNRVLVGDIVYTKSPTGEFPFGIVKQSEATSPVIVSPLYGVFTPISKDLGTIIDARFESSLVARNYLGPLVQKGAKNTIAITNRRFLEGRMEIPTDPEELHAISQLLRSSRAEIALLDRKVELLREQKRGLAQKLLSGDIPVQTVNERRPPR